MLDLHRYHVASGRDPFRRAPVLRLSRRAVVMVIALDVLAVVGLASLAMANRLPPGVAGFFAIGMGIGIATCIPIGIANVIVIDAAYRHGVRRAIGASIGGALADGIYASLGIFGIGPLLGRYPALPLVLYAISGCVLLVYGIVLLRSQPVTPGTTEQRSASAAGGQLVAGVVVGLGATLLNPSAIVTWIVIVGGHAAGITQGEAAAWVSGIVIGTFAWFLVVASLALRGRRVLRGNAMWMTRIVGLIVIGSGLFSFSRVAGHLFG
jgi:putative LysE/RhtB family amino acid efflux pump